MKDYKLSELKEDCIQCHIENIRYLGTNVCLFCKHNDYCREMFGHVKPCNWKELKLDEKQTEEKQ